MASQFFSGNPVRARKRFWIGVQGVRPIIRVTEHTHAAWFRSQARNSFPEYGTWATFSSAEEARAWGEMKKAYAEGRGWKGEYCICKGEVMA